MPDNLANIGMLVIDLFTYKRYRETYYFYKLGLCFSWDLVSLFNIYEKWNVLFENHVT